MNIKTHCRYCADSYKAGHLDGSELYIKELTKLISTRKSPNVVTLEPLHKCAALSQDAQNIQQQLDNKIETDTMIPLWVYLQMVKCL